MYGLRGQRDMSPLAQRAGFVTTNRVTVVVLQNLSTAHGFSSSGGGMNEDGSGKSGSLFAQACGGGGSSGATTKWTVWSNCAKTYGPCSLSVTAPSGSNVRVAQPLSKGEAISLGTRTHWSRKGSGGVGPLPRRGRSS